MADVTSKLQAEQDLNRLYRDATIAWGDSHNKLPPIINERSYRIGLEIGLAYGNHSDSILSSTQVEKLYGVDPYSNYSEYEHDGMCLEQGRMNVLCDLVRQRLSYYGDRFEHLRKRSEECAGSFADSFFDFVYVDGNHSWEFVKKDIEMWWPKVREGGVLAGHDYNHPNFPYVTYEVDKLAAAHGKQVNYLGAHVWVIFK